MNAKKYINQEIRRLKKEIKYKKDFGELYTEIDKVYGALSMANKINIISKNRYNKYLQILNKSSVR